MIANYHSIMAIDNDDGSCYYKTHHNFFAYAGGMKNDFDGHDNHHYCNNMLTSVKDSGFAHN